uniref:Uncharacterized protein n=1 Tax=Romanomermis culicivorax TaxID=13658 RepID=A0A915J4U2_ROMCU
SAPENCAGDSKKTGNFVRDKIFRRNFQKNSAHFESKLREKNGSIRKYRSTTKTPPSRAQYFGQAPFSPCLPGGPGGPLSPGSPSLPGGPCGPGAPFGPGAPVEKPIFARGRENFPNLLHINAKKPALTIVAIAAGCSRWSDRAVIAFVAIQCTCFPNFKIAKSENLLQFGVLAFQISKPSKVKICYSNLYWITVDLIYLLSKFQNRQNLPGCPGGPLGPSRPGAPDLPSGPGAPSLPGGARRPGLPGGARTSRSAVLTGNARRAVEPFQTTTVARTTRLTFGDGFVVVVADVNLADVKIFDVSKITLRFNLASRFFTMSDFLTSFKL